MKLEKLRLTNYRSCYQATVNFSDHLTLLVGENDAGKSNIIDALRASTPSVSGTFLRLERSRDLSSGADDETIRIERTYSELTRREDALFTPALVDAHRKLVQTTTFRCAEGVPNYSRIARLVGEAGIPDPEPDNVRRIAHVYLPPLRDAIQALDSADGNRLADVFEAIASPDEVRAFESQANTSFSDLAANNDTIQQVVQGVQAHLTSITQPVRHQVVDIAHQPQRMRRLIRAFRMHMAAAGLKPSDLAGPGLGYSNLLYIATVVLELERAREFDLTLLLLEEPEAHLHPQLQTVLLSYLQEQAEASAQTTDVDSTEPAGRIQVIATTHSPNLASSVSTSNVVVVKCKPLERQVQTEASEAEEPIPEEAEADLETEGASCGCEPGSETIAVALADIPLSERERRKIDRYLDTTRSSLLFARQIMLVEGIAEALLMRTFAETVVFPKSEDETTQGNKALREQFRAISVLPIDGVDFHPYLKLLLPSEGRLVDKVVVVTDGDSGAGAERRRVLEEAFDAEVRSGCLTIKVGGTTLEADLYGTAGNEPLLRNAFQEQHPKSLAKWDQISPGAEASASDRAIAFSDALKKKSLDLGKGDFAHVVALLLEESGTGNNFALPDYLAEAIRSVVIEEPSDVAEADVGGE